MASLEGLCQGKLALDLLARKDVWTDGQLTCRKTPLEVVSEKRHRLLESVVNTSKGFNLPGVLKRRVEDFIQRVGEEIFSFADDFALPQRFDAKVPDDIIWSSNGRIDEVKTLENLKEHFVSAQEFFTYSCVNCLEESIKGLWEAHKDSDWMQMYLRRMNRSFDVDDDRRFPGKFGLAGALVQQYWLAKLTNQPALLNRIQAYRLYARYGTDLDLEMNLCLIVSKQGTIMNTAARYFFRKIIAEGSLERLAVLHEEESSMDWVFYRIMSSPAPVPVVSYVECLSEKTFARFFNHVFDDREGLFTPIRNQILEALITFAPEHVKESESYSEIFKKYIANR